MSYGRGARKERNQQYSSKLLVTGMDCPDCAAKVEKAVKRMPGVGNATIVFPAGRLNVEYDSAANRCYSSFRQD